MSTYRLQTVFLNINQGFSFERTLRVVRTDGEFEDLAGKTIFATIRKSPWHPPVYDTVLQFDVDIINEDQGIFKISLTADQTALSLKGDETYFYEISIGTELIYRGFAPVVIGG